MVGEEKTLGARRASAARIVLLALCLVGSGAIHGQEQQFGTRVEVRRLFSDVRVVTHDGEPILGLAPEDFVVSVDGQRVEVEAADWIPDGVIIESMVDSGVADDPIKPTAPVKRQPRKRLIVMLFQKDFQLARLRGFFRVSDPATEFAKGLGDDDLVAVAVFGSHLQLHCDFTTQRYGLEDVLSVPEIFSDKNAQKTIPGYSLADHLDLDRARRADNLSEALDVLGDALGVMDGPKTIVLFGWGIGRFMGKMGVIAMDREYEDALRKLNEAQVTVFALDITDADYHSLEEGLMKLTQDTGGLYIKTHLFPETAIRKLSRMLTGHYQLMLVPPPDVEDWYKIRVRVRKTGAEVYVRQWQFHQSHIDGGS